jgi:hypothetical protein
MGNIPFNRGMKLAMGLTTVLAAVIIYSVRGVFFAP